MLKSKTITTDNDFLGPYSATKGIFSLSIYGDFIGTVTIQRSYDRGKTWLDADHFSNPVETFATTGEDYIWYRVGIKPGKLRSGSATIILGI